MDIYSFQGTLICNHAVVPDEMPDPTETHPFTFGCYRAEDVQSVDATDASDDATDAEERTAVTDGGTVSASTCPACEGDLANVQGVSACTHCAWNAY